MVVLNSLMRHMAKVGVLGSVVTFGRDVSCADEVVFDLPSSIECRDVTPKEFSMSHRTLKVIEAKFRISARMVKGNPANIVDFEYVMKTGKRMRVQDYLPNTTLESAVAEDQIEITAAAEDSKTTGLDAHVAAKPLNLGGSHSRGSKNSESSHYKQIAHREIVLASGTIEREHGVFFRIRASRTTSLEGGKEFTIVATVPKSWQSDLCLISCTARATKRSVISTSVVSIGASQIQVGMYLAGDTEAAIKAENLRISLDKYGELLAIHPVTNSMFRTISTETTSFFGGNKPVQRQDLRDAAKAVTEAQNQIGALTR